MEKIKKEDLRIVFMGTPDFAVSSLKSLIEAKYNVVGVFTNPDKQKGRGLKVEYSEVKKYALDNNIEVYQPIKLRNNEGVIEKLKYFAPDVICVTAYGKILPKEVLDFPKYGCINVHGSLLPKYRGAAPIQFAIINGDNKTGITTMYMDEGMDTGDMLLKESIDVTEEDDFLVVHDKLKKVGGELLVKTLNILLEKGTIERIKQNEEEATYAKMIDKEMTKINFSTSAKAIHNLTRALSPYMGTYFEFENKRYKVYKTRYKLEENIENIKSKEKNGAQIGEVVEISKKAFKVKCGIGYIYIDIIQPENSKKMDILSFVNSNKIKLGDILK